MSVHADALTLCQPRLELEITLDLIKYFAFNIFSAIPTRALNSERGNLQYVHRVTKVLWTNDIAHYLSETKEPMTTATTAKQGTRITAF